MPGSIVVENSTLYLNVLEPCNFGWTMFIEHLNEINEIVCSLKLNSRDKRVENLSRDWVFNIQIKFFKNFAPLCDSLSKAASGTD